jgi:hypothetical protein
LFKARVAVAIEETGDSPLDSKLEAVLPGVHQRLVANQREVLSLRTLVENRFSSLGSQVTEAFESQEEAMRERDHKTGEAYLSLARRFMGEGESLPGLAVRMRTAAATDSEPNSTTNLTTDSVPTMGRPHSLVMKHKSIHTLYYEWYGLETYTNTPVVGGIAFLERAYKTKWRRHFSPAEKQYFSRLQKVVRAIDEQSKREAKEPEEILDDWDALYRGEAKSSVTKMAMLVQTMGLIATQKARGKKQSNEETP